MKKIKAFIRTPWGTVDVIDPVKDTCDTRDIVVIVAEDGTKYVTHYSNILIVSKEETECDAKE